MLEIRIKRQAKEEEKFSGERVIMGFPGGILVKNLPANAGDAGDPGSIPGSGRSPAGANGNPLQYSFPKNPWTEDPGRLQSMGSQRDTAE